MTITTEVPAAQPAWTGADPVAVAAGLAALAEFLKAHPELPLGHHGDRLNYRPNMCSDEGNRDEVDRVAVILGVPAGRYLGGAYAARRDFGGGICYTAVTVDQAEIDRFQARIKATGDAA